jgi:hypothetical protein
MLGKLAEQEIGRSSAVDRCLDRGRLLIDVVLD